MKKISLRFFVCLVVFVFVQNVSFGKEVGKLSGRYEYFTQGIRIDNINTQPQAHKGLLEKRERGVRSIGEYQEKISLPPPRSARVDVDINVSYTKIEEKSKLEIEYLLGGGNMIAKSDKVPISQQLFQEAYSEIHVYLIFPNKLKIAKQIQGIGAIDNKSGKPVILQACPPEDTKLSQVLRKYNAIEEGTHLATESEKKEMRGEMERAFDNMTGNFGDSGKIAKKLKSLIKWGMNKAEEQRIKELEKKYGDSYSIYKIPIYVPEGISLSYSYIGRSTTLFFDKKLSLEDKIFVEIPRISFELNSDWSISRATLEGLAYEILSFDEKER